MTFKFLNRSRTEDFIYSCTQTVKDSEDTEEYQRMHSRSILFQVLREHLYLHYLHFRLRSEEKESLLAAKTSFTVITLQKYWQQTTWRESKLYMVQKDASLISTRSPGHCCHGLRGQWDDFPMDFFFKAEDLAPGKKRLKFCSSALLALSILYKHISTGLRPRYGGGRSSRVLLG